MKRKFWILTALIFLALTNGFSQSNKNKFNTENCTYNKIPLKGKVKVVNSFGDIKVQVVENFADINVKVVTSFPDACGKWQFVESFPDFTIQYVESFPDIKVKFVSSFPCTKN